MSSLKVVVIVSPDPSDIYFANQLIKQLNVVEVFVEKQKKSVGFLTRVVKALRKFTVRPWLLIKKRSDYLKAKPYYEKSRKIDLEHFGEEGQRLFPSEGCKVIYIQGCRAINEPVYVEELKKIKPDIIAVCGSSILKKDIIAIPQKGVLNLHGGLSQKYRGVWTTMWAVYNEEPEYVGVTVHYVSAGIDDGNIIYQERPDIVKDDNPETLYAKVVKLGIKMMIRAINDIQNDTIKDYPLKEKGSLYLAEMVTPDVLSKAWEKVDEGVMSQYLEGKAERDKKVITMMTGHFDNNS